MDDAAKIFERYEAVRSRLPPVGPAPRTVEIGALLDIAVEADAFVFDAFGVLNVGETPIPGAADRLDELRARGHAIRILTNAASLPHGEAVKKFRRLGMRVAPEEIVTSRDAALAVIGSGLWGCIAAPDDRLADVGAEVCLLMDDPADYARVDGFLFLSSKGWTTQRQARLAGALADRPRPLLIANADLVAPRDNGFSLEPGQVGHLLADLGHRDIRFLGKPFPEVFALTEASLGSIAPERIVMCGDTLHTDILGAAARGWRSVLVTADGLYAGHDAGAFCLRSGIHPDWRLARI